MKQQGFNRACPKVINQAWGVPWWMSPSNLRKTPWAVSLEIHGNCLTNQRRGNSRNLAQRDKKWIRSEEYHDECIRPIWDHPLRAVCKEMRGNHKGMADRRADEWTEKPISIYILGFRLCYYLISFFLHGNCFSQFLCNRNTCQNMSNSNVTFNSCIECPRPDLFVPSFRIFQHLANWSE